jgi:hypothetical protein
MTRREKVIMDESGRVPQSPKDRTVIGLKEIRVGERDVVRSIRDSAVALKGIIDRIDPLLSSPEKSDSSSEPMKTESFERVARLVRLLGSGALSLADANRLKSTIQIQGLVEECNKLLEALDRELGPDV